ncbi:hypothetical protein NIES2100_08690 [Calothrix sp. NIES-2100]|nr:hypothetical protein NIES2100_08690 [Calothrix sp. NIES-2100]
MNQDSHLNQLFVLPSQRDRYEGTLNAPVILVEYGNYQCLQFREMHQLIQAIVQDASIIFGTGVTLAAPGSVQGLHLIVYDIEAAHAELVDRGVEVSEVFHDIGGVFHHAGTEGRETGPDPERRDYASFASFSDPDGNGWVLQEVKTRAPGR